MINLKNKKSAIKYVCRCCKTECTTKLEFYKHIRKHRPNCFDCNNSFRSWNHYTRHLIHCSRLFEQLQLTQIDDVSTNETHTCQNCRRKYQKSTHLLNHQVNRCILVNIKIRIEIFLQKFAFVRIPK